ncbi:MAG: PilZ domain-containing protein [Alcanivoracaceae bacterium]|nr:PilZ domain-containing protein [Alcanivoracaceae bacterium]
MEEKRRFARAPFDGRAWLESHGERIPVELADLSLKGARILLPGDADVEVGSDVELTLELDDTDLRIPLHSRVTHTSGGRAGLEFVQVDVEHMQHLRRLVELNLDDGEELARFSD